MKEYMRSVLRDKDGRPSINRPFYFIFMVLFICTYFYFTWRTGKFPDVPASVFAIIALLMGYEQGKKLITAVNGKKESKK